MRTKTMLLSALLGTLGSVSLMAQSTNVYSLNAVGYVTVSIPPGYSILSCPLIASPDNTLNTILNASNGAFSGLKFYGWNLSAASYYPSASATATKWAAGGGTNTLNPGQAAFVFNPDTTNMTATFVGTVPSGSLTNYIAAGPNIYTLTASILPVSGVLTNTGNAALGFSVQTPHDVFYTFNDTLGAASGFNPSVSVKPNGQFTSTPIVSNLASGFFYYNTAATADAWVENFSVGQ
jgi:hypothetical protein